MFNRKNNEVEATSNEEMLVKVLTENMKTTRATNRNNLILRLAFLSYLVVTTLLFYSGFNKASSGQERPDHIAVIHVRGEIMEGPNQPASAETLIPLIQEAFENESSKAIFLDVNSPGGSPVQSARIYRAIKSLKAKYPNKPVYAVAGDTMASGAYYISAAADYIYADPTSMVGSIGVIMSGFGFTDVMDKVGVERRVYTAGENKSLLDPYSEPKDSSIERIRAILASTHSEFISDVRATRGDKISMADDEIFNGMIWSGREAVKIGLADGIGSITELKALYYPDAEIIKYEDVAGKLNRLLEQLSTKIVAELKMSQHLQMRF